MNAITLFDVAEAIIDNIQTNSEYEAKEGYHFIRYAGKIALKNVRVGIHRNFDNDIMLQLEHNSSYNKPNCNPFVKLTLEEYEHVKDNSGESPLDELRYILKKYYYAIKGIS